MASPETKDQAELDLLGASLAESVRPVKAVSCPALQATVVLVVVAHLAEKEWRYESPNRSGGRLGQEPGLQEYFFEQPCVLRICGSAFSRKDGHSVMLLSGGNA
jgi:hypothetical protein